MQGKLEEILVVFSHSRGMQWCVALAMVLPPVVLVAGYFATAGLNDGPLRFLVPLFDTAYQVLAGLVGLACLWKAGQFYFKDRKRLFGL